MNIFDLVQFFLKFWFKISQNIFIAKELTILKNINNYFKQNFKKCKWNKILLPILKLKLNQNWLKIFKFIYW